MNIRYTEPKISPEAPKPSDMNVNWYVWFRFTDPVTGVTKQLRYKKQINKYKVFKERLTEAKAVQLALEEKLKSGWHPVHKDVQVIRIDTISTAIKHILNIKDQTLKLKTKQTYKHITKLFTDWLEKKAMLNYPVKNITPAVAQEYMDYLLLKKMYSGRTFNDHLIILRTFFNCFIERDWIYKNPFRSVKRKTATIGRNHAYNDKEKTELENYLKKSDTRLYYLTQIMFHCFIRRTELTFLQVMHIDLVNNTIIIPGQNAKNNSQETVVIPVGLEPVLKEMCLEKYLPTDYIFGRRLLTQFKRYTNPNHISTRHNNIVKNLGISSEKGLYSWKHTGVCHYYYATGKDVYSVMRQLRHRDLNTTMIYLKSLGLVQNDAFRNARVA